MDTDITQMVERLELFEERLKVRFDALYAKAREEDWGLALSINAELYPTSGTGLDRDLAIIADLLDCDDRLVERGNEWIFAKNFFGFQSFSMYITLADTRLQQIKKIRLYPQAC